MKRALGEFHLTIKKIIQMKWDFFYDEGQGKAYESTNDWYKEIRYLMIPSIIMVVLGITLYLYFRFFHF